MRQPFIAGPSSPALATSPSNASPGAQPSYRPPPGLSCSLPPAPAAGPPGSRDRPQGRGRANGSLRGGALEDAVRIIKMRRASCGAWCLGEAGGRGACLDSRPRLWMQGGMVCLGSVHREDFGCC
ncbi:hypothetical protein P7K49_035573 [Saguinus oedipus]|uniref:Uncharacterized protein n=1 Tax=Saguinus oedipus TaxID=9490 RepID=A0ABQ9TN14_SAGOE|nr:hypothetical protein P7K49_035573 [Saguinus oedipus]